jgi:hypothetical protein
MSDTRRVLLSALLLGLAAVSIGLIVVLVRWAGRIEATLLIFGDPVFVTLDARHPRVFSLVAVPTILIVAAIWVGAGRERILRRLRRRSPG